MFVRLILILSATLTATALANWPQAAGPNGTWSVPDAKAPVSWSVARNQNILWRAPLPNGGQSGIAVWGNRLFLTSVRALWELVNAGSLQKLKPLIEPYASGFLWDPVMLAILAAPSWSLLGGFGILLLLLGRRKKPLIGYQR